MRALVEDHRHMGRRIRPGVPLDVAVEHVAEARDRPDGQTVGLARQGRQRVEGPEDEGRAVDQVQVMSLAEGHGKAPCEIHPPDATNETGAPLRRAVLLQIRREARHLLPTLRPAGSPPCAR